ncbi:MAG: hypothetical protein PVH24_04565 [Candidatus Zixiibacteriota bacterium]|jgi:hypothetical protein
MEKLKQCTTCGTWFTLEDILTDPAVHPLGMLCIDEKRIQAYYFFQHRLKGCDTTFAMSVSEFSEKIDEPIPPPSSTPSSPCTGHCVHLGRLSQCTTECHLSPFRQFLLNMIAKKSALEDKKV